MDEQTLLKLKAELSQWSLKVQSLVLEDKELQVELTSFAETCYDELYSIFEYHNIEDEDVW